MEYTVRLERIAAQPLAVVRRRATPAQLSRVVPEACGLVWSTLRTAGITGAGRHVAVYLDDAGAVEVGVEMEAGMSAVGEVLPSVLPAGEVAATTHFGPYRQLAAAHDAIHRWCRTQGRLPTRPCWELYGHWREEWNSEPGLIRTDVYYLLAPGP